MYEGSKFPHYLGMWNYVYSTVRTPKKNIGNASSIEPNCDNAIATCI